MWTSATRCRCSPILHVLALQPNRPRTRCNFPSTQDWRLMTSTACFERFKRRQKTYRLYGDQPTAHSCLKCLKILCMSKEEFFEQAVNAFGDDKLDEAIDNYKKALQIDANYQDALHGLGMALFNSGRVDEAIATAKRLVEIDEDDILAHTSLSKFYQSQNRIEEAEKEGNAARILGWKQELRKDQK